MHRCVRAEPFPNILAKLVKQIEMKVHRMFEKKDIPNKWHLNTCLVNFYGTKLENGKKIDTARVGEHKDFEPGPVASISLGERAMFQFVSSDKAGVKNQIVCEQWLDNGSLQIFGGSRWKSQLFHRVQRVDRREKYIFPIRVDDFETRRINFTFRYVPVEHIFPFATLPKEAKMDVQEYMEQLARNSVFFTKELKKS
jgi:hypothetical protein